ncbi:DNA cytosine methyltransferase [Cohnella zeiphila]|uniref:DNA (cytosine-5-)-methyltransferase n=1 Tax=Cohnella zeiphila TaxID=2761120 RepID=A0A7X0SL64_9BACL|nr:DNA cytosine methyltransferase [Cohnella zeiphila]MBB6731914.1 DNA cytosine methyltransferase [Cohnella zeiphila]
MNALSLFSGIGGIDLACEWAGIKTVAFCEREPFPQAVLRKHWPDVPIYDDVCTLTKERLDADGIDTQTVGLISAGYPCQPYSLSGEREGQEDDRALWPEVKRLLQEIRPRWFVGENVAGHVSLGLDDVLSDLDSLSYSWEAIVLPAAAVGAPHRRSRVIILGHSERVGFTRESWGGTNEFASNGYFQLESESIGAIRAAQSRMGRMLDGVSERLDQHRWPTGRGENQHEWEPPRIKNEIKNRAARIKALGNAVVPQQIYPIVAAIKQIDDLLRDSAYESNESTQPKAKAE